jgi:SAM-dependent methyltransferase
MDKWTSGAAYDLWMGRWSRLLADEFLQWLDPPAARQWLDVCCGSGVMSQAIGERCSPAGVVGIDMAPAQVGFAREHRGLGHIVFSVGDASALPFRDASFDIAACGLGLNYVPDSSRVLQEMQRVVRPLGTVAAYVWDYAEGARFLREFWDAALAVDPEAPAFDQARRFPLCTRDGLERLFAGAGLEHVRLQAIEITTCFANFEEYWEPLCSEQGSAPNYLASRNAATRHAIRERLKARLAADAQGAIVLPARAWAVSGRRP